MSLEKVVLFLKGNKRGEKVSWTEVLEFVKEAQPSTIAALLSVYPHSVMTSLLLAPCAAYVPPGWLLQEKARRAIVQLILLHKTFSPKFRSRVAEELLCESGSLGVSCFVLPRHKTAAGGERALRVRHPPPLPA